MVAVDFSLRLILTRYRGDTLFNTPPSISEGNTSGASETKALWIFDIFYDYVILLSKLTKPMRLYEAWNDESCQL